jgi:hypothetical protein
MTMSQQYSATAWKRLGRAIAQARGEQKMTRPALGAAMRSSSKSILRLEGGRIYGDPQTAPPGDYNSERYVLRRLALLEMALEWPQGHALDLLEGGRG